MPASTAEVRLHGTRVGELRYDQGGSEFLYEADLSATDHAVLGQTFEDDPRARRRVSVGVPNWFENLLPEGALREFVIRELGGGNVGNYTLLVRLGAALPGAVSVHADDVPDDDIQDGPRHLPEHELRHSLAGYQLKYSMHADRLTTPITGRGGWWIAKLPDRTLKDLTSNEYLTMTWLKAAGFEVPEVHLVTADSIEGLPLGVADPSELVYLIERFDRTPAGPVHVEDFAQVADVGPIHKYSESGVSYDGLAAVITGLTGHAGYLEFIARLAAMIVVGNTDAHLKNWALIYRDRRTPSLAPVDDFHSLSVYQRFRYSPMALSLGGEKMPMSVSLDHFRRLAEASGESPESTVTHVLETLDRMRVSLNSEAVLQARGRFDSLGTHFDDRLARITWTV